MRLRDLENYFDQTSVLFLTLIFVKLDKAQPSLTPYNSTFTKLKHKCSVSFTFPINTFRDRLPAACSIVPTPLQHKVHWTLERGLDPTQSGHTSRPEVWKIWDFWEKFSRPGDCWPIPGQIFLTRTHHYWALQLASTSGWSPLLISSLIRLTSMWRAVLLSISWLGWS